MKYMRKFSTLALVMTESAGTIATESRRCVVKIPNAAAVKELNNQINFILVGSTGAANEISVDLKTLNLSEGLYEFVGRYQHAFISLFSGRYSLFGVANYPEVCSLTEDGLLDLYVGGWYTNCYCRRLPASL